MAHRRHPLIRPLFAIGAPVHRHVVRPLVTLVRPYVSFTRDRLTPGELGLELTTLLAIGGVGLFFFVVYLTELDRTLAPTPFDNEILELAADLRSDMLVDVAKMVTDLGAFPTVAGLVAAVTCPAGGPARGTPRRSFWWPGWRSSTSRCTSRRTRSPGRGRPDQLVDTSGSAYPSGHAAYAMTWVAAAVILTRRLRLVASGTLVFVALGIAAAVGVTRVYLRVHWWSDVAGGWGLAAGIFALLAGIALVVEHIRHNGRERAAESAPARGT